MLGNRISELRKKKGLTQNDMATYLQVSRQAYSSYETEKYEMDLKTLRLLADYYNVTTDYLLGRQEAIPSFLSNEERVIIERYRALDERGKNTVRHSLNYEYFNVCKITKT